jgi:hypothetical protein
MISDSSNSESHIDFARATLALIDTPFFTSPPSSSPSSLNKEAEERSVSSSSSPSSTSQPSVKGPCPTSLYATFTLMSFLHQYDQSQSQNDMVRKLTKKRTSLPTTTRSNSNNNHDNNDSSSTSSTSDDRSMMELDSGFELEEYLAEVETSRALELLTNGWMLNRADFAEGVSCAVGAKRGNIPTWYPSHLIVDEDGEEEENEEGGEGAGEEKNQGSTFSTPLSRCVMMDEKWSMMDEARWPISQVIKSNLFDINGNLSEIEIVANKDHYSDESHQTPKKQTLSIRRALEILYEQYDQE